MVKENPLSSTARDAPPDGLQLCIGMLLIALWFRPKTVGLRQPIRLDHKLSTSSWVLHIFVAWLQSLLDSHYHISGNVSKPSPTLSPCASLRLQVQGSPELFHWMRHDTIVRCKKSQYVTGRSELSVLVVLACPCWFKDLLLSLPQMTNNQKWHLYHCTNFC